ncbi:cysteine hydrolase family protein [Methyloligella solikamskensis]|uniref:Cysteine hydrolase family protein n=1 Tax=Methyloligella solikamskensis TaxID=1177756 RepID=A0ABW3J7R3_9HYPH
MNWKTDYRSFYYEGAPEPEDPVLTREDTALLVIDVQNTYLHRKAPGEPGEPEIPEGWEPFHKRMDEIVTPAIASLISEFRDRNMAVLHARIACQLPDGRDRSLSQKKPGWNNLLLPKNEFDSQIIEEIAPGEHEIVVTKTTDSALTGTNLRLILHNMGIKHVVCVGVFTDQCVSSTVRSLADESFDVIVVEDACAAGTDELHMQEIEIMNMIYCAVMSKDELVSYLP